MKVIWTVPAVADRTMIYDYIDARNPRAAIALDMAFETAARTLAIHPEIGRAGRVSGTRELMAHRHYFILYEISIAAVIILAIVHTARRWPPVEGNIAEDLPDHEID